MDEYSGKRAAGGVVTHGRRSGLVSRDEAEDRDKNTQFCNRLGCNGRLKHSKSAQNGCSEKFNSSRPSLQAKSGKEMIGSSSRSSVIGGARNSFQVSRKKLSSQSQTDSSETSSVQDEPEVSDVASSPRRVQTGLQSARDYAESSKSRSISSSIASNSRPMNVFRQKSGMGIPDSPLGSSVSFASGNTCQGTKNGASASGTASASTSTGTSRYGLKNLRCSSITDVVPSGCSSSESNLSRKKDMVKKRNTEVESNSAIRGKKTSGTLSEEGRGSTSNRGISISDSRRGKNWSPSGRNGVGSVRTQRSTNANGRTSQEHANSWLPVERPVVISQLPQLESPNAEDVLGLSNQFSSEASLNRPTSFGHPGSSDSSLAAIGPNGLAELSFTRSLMNRNGMLRYNMNGIAEVLLALERIEQDEELTYEQLLALETNLFVGGLGFYDQHRDMRLDIDNMSYEELLALEEKMGTVSTALSEDALLKCLRRSIYQPTPLAEGTTECSGNEDDVKCSICQEEFAIGDEVGRLKCEHGYHVGCIHEWLRLKNWCPVCKASVGPSQSSSSPSS